jgi:hypothetical protein
MLIVDTNGDIPVYCPFITITVNDAVLPQTFSPQQATDVSVSYIAPTTLVSGYITLIASSSTTGMTAVSLVPSSLFRYSKCIYDDKCAGFTDTPVIDL